MDLSKLKNKKILIVEDDLTNSELINEIFDSLEVEIKSVYSGNEAIEICRKENFDVVLMDIQLPGRNGYEATREIKKMKPDMVIIAQTAYAFEADRQKSLESGCSDYISKPFKKEELLKMVIRYL